MKITHFLDLNRTEKHLIRSLKATRLNVSQLARITKISRATLYPHIKKLVSRGFLNTSTVGKRKFYASTTSTTLGEQLVSAVLTQNKTVSVPSVFTYFSGLKQIQKLWLNIGKQPKGSRVVAFQTNSALQYSLSKMSVAVAKENHKNILDNKIIIEQYAEEGMHELVNSHLKNKKIQSHFPATDFTSRTTSTHLLPRGLFSEPVEIFIFLDTVLFIDWKSEVGYEIKNHSIASTLKQFFKIMQLHGKLVNNTEMSKKVFSS